MTNNHLWGKLQAIAMEYDKLKALIFRNKNIDPDPAYHVKFKFVL